MQRHDQFQREYERQKLECRKTGKVVLVIPRLKFRRKELEPRLLDGNQASFMCVSPADPQYQAQRVTEPEPLPTKLAPLLAAMIGQNVDVALDRLGGPQGEPIIDGDVAYTWSSSTRYTVPYTTLFDEDRTKSCEIQLFTDRAIRIIKRFAWTEKRGGCRTYAANLKGLLAR
jgi:hypothetical protein